MTEKMIEILCAASAVVMILGLTVESRRDAHAQQPAAPVVVPAVPTPAGPTPAPAPKPDDRRRPLLPHPFRPNAGDASDLVMVFGDRVGPGNISPQVDYPEDLWFKNIGSKKDGAGMCVFTAFEFSALWAGLEDFRGFRDWCAQNYAGGGTPDKLQKLMEAYCKHKSIPVPILKQYEGSDIAWLRQALANGWLPGVTLFHSSRKEYPRLIYHMTNCANFEPSFAILDNNFPAYEWFATAQAAQNAIEDHGKYWGFAIVAPGAPPIPRLPADPKADGEGGTR